MKELQPSDRNIAYRVIQSLFTDDNEAVYKGERNWSHIVRVPSGSS
jgi:hypothetical protein